MSAAFRPLPPELETSLKCLYQKTSNLVVPSLGPDIVIMSGQSSCLPLISLLRLTMLDGFVLNGNFPFVILQASGGISGQFANVVDNQWLTTSDGSLQFLVRYGPSSTFSHNQVILLAFREVLPGDYNANGTVDAADYVLWRKNNNTAATLPNDATPGTSPADYTVWRSHFGQPPGSGSDTSANAAVPEPATYLLLILGVAGWCLRRGAA